MVDRVKYLGITLGGVGRDIFRYERENLIDKAQKEATMMKTYINPAILTLKYHTNANPISANSRSKLWNFFMTKVFILDFFCKLYVKEHAKLYKMSTRSPKNIN